MKGRIISSIWIIVALALCYFCFNGVLMNWLICFCLLIALMEIISVTDQQPWLMKPNACPPRCAWLWQAMVLCLALVVCFYLNAKNFAVIIIASTLSDTGAFVVGKLIGRHHLAITSKISPNKTLEGFIGGAILPLMTIPICLLFGLAQITLPLLLFVSISGITSELGDLLGSATKRQLGIKDSGQVLSIQGKLFLVLEYPVRGHGGYLDRVDSLSFNLLFYAIIHILASP